MANPEHKPNMNNLDNITVILYRVGLTIFAISCILKSIESLFDLSIFGESYFLFVSLSIGLSCANIHLYVAFLRWLVPFICWLGFITFVVSTLIENQSAKQIVEVFSFGFFYATASMLAIKEYFCFKIKSLFLVPPLLIYVVMAIFFEVNDSYALCLVGIIYLWLCIKKWSMPLHFDIGDKNNYQI